jgi:hypothetical protein
MKRTFRLAGVLAVAAVLAPTAFAGEKEPAAAGNVPQLSVLQRLSARYVPQPTAPNRPYASGLPMNPLRANKPCIVRPVYVVSVGTRNGTAESALRASKNIELTQALVAILNETQSPDVLLMTMETLAELKAEPRLVIPALIRNAERLNMLEGICTSDTRNRDQKKILDMLEFFTRRTRLVAKSKKPLTPYSSSGTTVPASTYFLPPKMRTPSVTPASGSLPAPQPVPTYPAPTSGGSASSKADDSF